ncbi:hypothetical protein CAFE_27760 [Caprobacter fermentans]|uniref:Uncharacterized protein n=1 Tax=Caproicibacter fermentans TaxID=2576756 RepID=A0A6N8I2R6_9FIRM|nr:hypothetical protein [Caproicibacter fermentans]MVB12047.1 hypothetical protein [Caproicibacter fermentans]OCN03019.1 hypothetical protein A7X67_03765 [Clostridium sp. W14A]
MENKKHQKTSIAALIVSVLPLATFIPILLKITISDEIRNLWAGANILSILAGLCLSIVCVKSSESRSVLNIISTIICVVLILIVIGIIILALFLNFLQ